MNIAMFTNTYLPQVGGVARSVERFTQAYRARGHRVLVVAPTYEDQPEEEEDVVRLPALPKFNGSDFSMVLPVKPHLQDRLDDFGPEIIHSHHPYLLGDTALRAAADRELPLVFTHHTMYEHYTHYVPLDSPALRRFVMELSTGYANLADRVIAPSGTIADILVERGVTSPITVVPTGVDLASFSRGDGAAARRELGIPADAFVVGHVGRLAEEKNLPFLGRAVTRYLADRPQAWFLIVGSGPAQEDIRRTARERGVEERVVFAGTRSGQDLVDAYHAMDVFAFASKSETQGMVLVEALAAGKPLAALDAPGVSDVVRDRDNGRLLAEEDEAAFAEALDWVRGELDRRGDDLAQRARETAVPFGQSACADRSLRLYREALTAERDPIDPEAYNWSDLLRGLAREWDLWANRAAALAEAVSPEEPQEAEETP